MELAHRPLVKMVEANYLVGMCTTLRGVEQRYSLSCGVFVKPVS